MVQALRAWRVEASTPLAVRANRTGKAGFVGQEHTLTYGVLRLVRQHLEALKVFHTPSRAGYQGGDVLVIKPRSGEGVRGAFGGFPEADALVHLLCGDERRIGRDDDPFRAVEEDPAHRLLELKNAVPPALVASQDAVVSDLLVLGAVPGIPGDKTDRLAVDRRDETVLFRYRRIFEEKVVETPPLLRPFRRPARVEPVRIGEHVGKRPARKPGDLSEFDAHQVTSK